MADFSGDTTFLGDLFGGGQTYDIPGIDWSSLFSGGGGLPDYMSDPGLAGLTGGQQLYFDNQTGQLVTLAQAQAIDPTFTGSAAGAGGVRAPTTSLSTTNGQGGTSTNWGQLLPAALTAALGLGTLGVAGAGLFGAGNQPGTATRTETTTPNALANPQVQQLLGSTGTTAGGTAGAPGAYTGGTGLQGADGQAAANLQGPQGLLQGQIGAIPQLNPAIQAAIGQNALGFSQGNVPTLNNPQAQQYFQNILGGQNASVDYQTGNSLQNALQELRGRGFAGGSEIFREGAPAAAMGPVVAQGNAQKAMNLGNVNAQQLAYATQLPKLGADMNTAQLNQQNVPFAAYNQSAQTQSQIPLELLRLLTGQGGSTSTQTSTGAAPNLLQSLMQVLPIAAAGGSALNQPSVTGTPANSLTGAPGTPSLYAQLAGLFG